MNRISLCIVVAFNCIAPRANAVEFETRRLQGIVNLELSFGTSYRVEDRDAELIGIGNGGASRNTNGDDGDLNYDEGFISQAIRGTGEVIIVADSWGAYARGVASYDRLQSDRLDRTALSSAGEELAGTGFELRENYLAASITIRGTPFYFRIGDQILSWNETSYIRDGLDLVSPFDVAAIARPTSQPADSRVPQGMLWVASSLTQTIAVEAYYQYEWKPSTLPPIGSYFSPVDVVGGDGVGVLQLDPRFSDLGTDLDDAFALPPGTLGVDRHFMQLPGRGSDRPRDAGQWGLSLMARFMDGLATKVGLHYMHYHSRLPIVSTVTGDAAAQSATSEVVVAGRAAGLESIYLSAGLDPTTADANGRAAAEALTLSEYANASGVLVEYPGDIDAFGGSFSFSLLRTGTLLAGEVTRHVDAPVQRSISTVSNAALSPVLFDPTIGVTPLGQRAPRTIVHGFGRGQRTQGAFSVTQLFGPRARATQVLLDLSFGWVHMDDMPGDGDVKLNPVDATRNSWGYRVAAAANYSSVFGGLNLTPRIVWAHDLSGTTPAPTSTYLNDREVLSIGIAADYLVRTEGTLTYTKFWGGGNASLLRDRDYVELRLTYAF